MDVNLDSGLEAALRNQAHLQGLSPEELALRILRQHFIVAAPPEPRDEWERELLGAARPWGISLSNAALSRDNLYD